MRKEFGEDVKFDRKFGKKRGGTVDFSSPWGLFKLWASALEGGKKKSAGKNLIGIVYVEGTILTGKPEPSPFSSEPGNAYSTPLRKALDKLADDKDVKAVVLRVNSPGGSAVASEIILNAAHAGQGEEAGDRVDGLRGRQRRLLRLDGGRHDLRRPDDDHRLDRRLGRQVRHDRHVEPRRHRLGQQPPRRQRRDVQFGGACFPTRNARKCRPG